MNIAISFDEPTTGIVEKLIAALTRTADNQERLIAGQAAAIEKVEAATKGGATTRSRKAAEKPADEPKKEEPAAATAPVAEQPKSYLPDVSDEPSLKAFVSAWTGAVEGADRATRVDFLKAIASHFAVAPNFAALAGLGAEKLQQIVFYIERHKTGATVDFNAEYDFDGDPAQGGATAAAPADEVSDFG